MVAGFPKTKGLIVANTYTQLLNATIPALTSLLTELNIKYKLVMSGPKKHITILGTTCFLYSLEKYDNIRGIEVGWIAGDEIAYSCREAVDVIFGRLRDKTGPLLARFVTSPKGFNFFYDFCQSDNVTTFTGRTKDNIYLPESYYKQLVELYGGEDSPLAKQELFGEYVNLTSGQVYFSFKREDHVKPTALDKTLPVYVAIDFNVGNMSLVYMQYHKGMFKVARAIKLTDANSNTFSAGHRIRQDLEGYEVLVVPDSTGKARTTKSSSAKSDIQILKDYSLRVLETLNPRIKDRQNTVNVAFIKDQIQIDPSCKELITELETLSHDDTEGDKVHLSVAMGYVLWKLNPLKPPQQPSKTITSPFLKRA
jgi:hypothetical protein